MIAVRFTPTFAGWREAVRPLLAARVPQADLAFETTEDPQANIPGLLQPQAAPMPASGAATLHVPRALLALAERVACHRDEGKWPLLYRAFSRAVAGDVAPLENPLDVDRVRLHAMAAAVDKDVHRMQAFVRFCRVYNEAEQGERYVAWYRPDHLIVARAAPFFADRFSDMLWSILTPDASVHWDGRSLQAGPGVPRRAAPREDEMQPLWRSYYGATFNPARANVRKTVQEMPRRFWHSLPEARLIKPLLDQAAKRTEELTSPQANSSALAFLPPSGITNLVSLAEAASVCQGCPLWKHATRTVFGEGPSTAAILLVGEQPGDQEDHDGKPFVGPAGRVLDEALAAAGLDRREVYITNAVKHFKFTQRGPLRLHQRPRGREVQACRPWLAAEIHLVRPRVLVALGSTAAHSLFGPRIGPTRDRGRLISSPFARACLVTYHPSAVLRADDPHLAMRLRAALSEDLRRAAELANGDA